MSNPKVLVDARLPWGSGIGRYVRNIVPAVAKRNDSCTFTLLVSSRDADRARETTADCTNVSVVETSISSFSLAEQRLLPSLASGYDLTWFTNYWVPLRWKGRFVATVHDVIHLEPDFPASFVKRFAATRTFAKVRNDAAHVVFVSRFTARQFEAKVGAPVAATVIHHGIDHRGMGLTSTAKRENFALVVSAAKAHKNLPIVLEAWQRADIPHWQLVIVTPSDNVLSSINLAERAGRTANVEVLRGVSDAELDSLYTRAGLVLVPSRYEGFGLPLLEAMAAGAPVISSTAEALVEVAAGATIPFVSAGDQEGWVEAIRRMTTLPISGRREGGVIEENVAWARTFTWDSAALSTADVLRDVLRS